jgi:hypothetical protein
VLGGLAPARLHAPTFLQGGRGDSEGGPDLYAYAVRFAPTLDQGASIQRGPRGGEVLLLRAPRTGGLQTRAWKLFAGLDGAGHPRWTPQPASAQPVIVDRNGVGEDTSVVYVPELQRYLVLTQHTRHAANRLTLLESPAPWGPWRTVVYTTLADPWARERRAFRHAFVPGSFSTDGQHFTLALSGLDTRALVLVDGRFETVAAPTLGAAPLDGSSSGNGGRTVFVGDRSTSVQASGASGKGRAAEADRRAPTGAARALTGTGFGVAPPLAPVAPACDPPAAGATPAATMARPATAVASAAPSARLADLPPGSAPTSVSSEPGPVADASVASPCGAKRDELGPVEAPGPPLEPSAGTQVVQPAPATPMAPAGAAPPAAAEPTSEHAALPEVKANELGLGAPAAARADAVSSSGRGAGRKTAWRR